MEHRCRILKNYRGGNATEIKNTYTNRSPLGHYFLLPNEIFTLGLSPGELSVYAYLIFCEDRETHQCWPSIGRISQHTGMSANTISKYIRQLEEKHLINVEPTKVRTKSGEVRNGHHPSYPGGGELQAGTRFGNPARAKMHEEKAVKPNTPLCGPVCGFESRQGSNTSKALDRPCWASCDQQLPQATA